MTARTEREIAADTVLALLVDGVFRLPKKIDALAAAGITTPDFEAAIARRHRTGFVQPAHEVPGVEPLASVTDIAEGPKARGRAIAPRLLRMLEDGPFVDAGGHVLAVLAEALEVRPNSLQLTISQLRDEGRIRTTGGPGRGTFSIELVGDSTPSAG